MKYKPWREMTEQEIYKLKKDQCCKCYYSYGMNAGKAGGICDYLCMVGHSRGCSPMECKDKGIFKPKRGQKKKKGVRPIV